jgi:hypothetical protein
VYIIDWQQELQKLNVLGNSSSNAQEDTQGRGSGFLCASLPTMAEKCLDQSPLDFYTQESLS